MEEPPPIPDYAKTTLTEQHTIREQLGAMKAMPFAWDRPDPKKMLAYRKELALLVRLGFCLKNTGKMLVDDARVLLELPKRDRLRIVDEPPQRPLGPTEIPRVASFAAHLRAQTRSIDVHDCGDRWEMVARLGKVQPDAVMWSLPFWIGSAVAVDLAVVARVFGDNIATPIEVPLKIAISVEAAWLEDESERCNDDGSDDEVGDDV